MTWPQVQLGSVVTFLDHLRRPITEKDRMPGPIPYYGANGQQDSVAESLFDEPLVLLAEDGGHFDEPSRGVAYRIEGPSWVNNHAHVLRPRESIDVSYLGRVLENRDLRSFVSGSTRGKLTKSSAERIPIPLPPLPEQRRIAAILDQADDLGLARRRWSVLVDDLQDSFVQSAFVGSSPSHLSDHLEFLTSGSRGWAKYYSPNGAPFLRIQNVGKGRLLLEDLARVVPPATKEAHRTRVRTGDVLLSVTADLGRAAVVSPELAGAHVSQHLALLRLRPSLIPQFLAAYLASSEGLAQLMRLNRGATKQGLNFDDIRSLRVPLVPVEDQRRLAQQLASLGKLRELSRRHVQELDHLVTSLGEGLFAAGAGRIDLPPAPTH